MSERELDNDAWWQDRREEVRREADDIPKRAKLFRCADRTCGGLDCANCYGEQAAMEFLSEQEEQEQ